MGIMLLSQSGTMGIVLADRIKKMNTIELEKLVSLGNMAGVDFSDLIEYGANDEHTDVILIYMEDVKNGKRFIKTAQRCTKPIIVLRGGRSDAGSKATASHTGALAGSDCIYTAAFEQAGVIQVDTIEELFIAAEVFTMCELPKGVRVGILSPGGGANISCVDHCEGLEIPEFTYGLMKSIKDYLPIHAPIPINPVDMAATFGFEDYHNIIEAITYSGEVDMLISNVVMTDGFIDEWNKLTVPGYVFIQSPIPIIGSWMGEEGKFKSRLEKYIPVFNEPAIAAYAARLLVQQKIYLRRKE